MDPGHPTHATPFGCVVTLFAAMCLVLSGLCWRAFFLAGNADDPERTAEIRETAGTWGAASGVLGLLLLWISWRMIRSADMSDPRDPDKPSVRF